MADKSKWPEKAATLLDQTLDCLIEKTREGKATAADLSVARDLCRDAGLSIGLRGEPSGPKAKELMDSMRTLSEDEIPDFPN